MDDSASDLILNSMLTTHRASESPRGTAHAKVILCFRTDLGGYQPEQVRARCWTIRASDPNQDGTRPVDLRQLTACSPRPMSGHMICTDSYQCPKRLSEYFNCSQSSQKSSRSYRGSSWECSICTTPSSCWLAGAAPLPYFSIRTSAYSPILFFGFSCISCTTLSS